MLLSVVRHRQRTGRVPDRPIVLCFTADEEAGGHSRRRVPGRAAPRRARGLSPRRSARSAGSASPSAASRLYLIEAAEKGMAWLKLTARGTAGHGSMVNPDNAVSRLTAAVARIGAYEWPVRLTPTMEVLLATVGDLAGTEVTPENGAGPGPGVRRRHPDARRGHQQHVQPTMLQSGYKVNVVPTEATAYVDGRFLPGYEDEFSSHARGAGRRGDRHRRAELPAALGDAVRRRAGRRDGAQPARRGPGRHRRAVPDERRHRRQALPRARHAVLRVRAAPAARPTSTSPRCSTASTSGCPIDALEFGARVLDRFLDEV